MGKLDCSRTEFLRDEKLLLLTSHNEAINLIQLIEDIFILYQGWSGGRAASMSSRNIFMVAS